MPDLAPSLVPPQVRGVLRCAGAMGALAAILGDPVSPPELRAPALQLLAAMAAEAPAVAEFAGCGGVAGLMALVCSDSGAKPGKSAGSAACMQAAALLGCLVQKSAPARSAIWAAGGGSVLLPALPGASGLAQSGARAPPCLLWRACTWVVNWRQTSCALVCRLPGHCAAAVVQS